MNIGVQYYRPPFPVQKHWADDLKRIRDTGFDTLQLWVTWAWTESTPGIFEFRDYDQLVEMADHNGLKLILSTIAELQPHWIHEIVPGSEMIDDRGQRVVSSLRAESNFGLTPGGCTENPAVWDRMAGFLSQVVTRYRGASNLAGWDAWNELRWHEQSNAFVCFCPHCLHEFRAWLDSRYNGLAGLNHAWQRRYSSWREVMPPKNHWHPYTESPFTEAIAWQRFVTWKANRHGRRRFELIKALDPQHLVTVHAGDPTPLSSGGPETFALDRGNDWIFADDLDGIGCSSFPRLAVMDDTTFTARVEFARSAASAASSVIAPDPTKTDAQSNRKKQFWLSEVQGGRGSLDFNLSVAVDASAQQRWLWRGFASGADKILFWCWRDEVFGRESAGFGINGRDGHASARITAMQHTGAIIARHHKLLSSYICDTPEVGVLFSPSSYYLHWTLESNARKPRNALEGYCQALVNLSIPYAVIEEDHLDALTAPQSTLRVLFLPRLLVTGEKLENALATFVRRGGTLVCESECGAFTPEGIYRAPEERFFARLGLLPGGEIGRRELPPHGMIELALHSPLRLYACQWLTPWAGFPATGRVWATHPDGVLVGEASIGNNNTTPGRIIHVGTFLGDTYPVERTSRLEQFITHCVGASTPPLWPLDPSSASLPDQTARERWLIKTGTSGTRRIVCVFAPPDVTSARLAVSDGVFKGERIQELISGRTLTLNVGSKTSPTTIDIPFTEWGIGILCDTSM
ncbi:beta-galactosidase [Geminisphaera colitermitum]|uniref:beta-galactosidase n=1 Tax=Geminisphaera colitermitum TaxID=1148786 RepID=UPI000158C768|nr:beta-galactosidase [Geminisphaera colitermitum]